MNGLAAVGATCHVRPLPQVACAAAWPRQLAMRQQKVAGTVRQPGRWLCVGGVWWVWGEGRAAPT